MSLSETFPGGCYISSEINHEVIRCVWEAEDCGAYTYRSFAKIEESQVSNKCRLNHRQWSGMCLDELLCTGDASNCRNGESDFAKESPFCNFEYNRYPDSPAGPFWLGGSCSVSGNPTCVYSESACTAAGGTYQIPSDATYNNGCTCDNVKVGACRRSDNSLMCAVSSNACDSGDTYIEWNELNGAIDCRLCADFPKVTRTWVDELDGKIMPPDYNRLPTKPSEANDDNLKIISIGIGLGVALTALSCFFCGRYSRRSSAKEFDSNSSNTDNSGV